MQTTPPGLVDVQADELSSEARPSRAQALRLQALELLRTAEQLDKLRPYSVTHVHKHGESHYLVWAPTMPQQADLTEFIHDFEPQYDEYLSIGTGGVLEEMVGLLGVVSAGDQGEPEDEPGSTSGDVGANLRAGGCCCPFCGNEDIVGGSVEVDAGIAWQEVTCNACDKAWRDQYSLTGFQPID